MGKFKTLTPRRLQHATRWLAQRDGQLDLIFQTYGYPPLWHRPPGFSTLVHIILEQQVSLASANATFARLQTELSGTITPTGIMSLDNNRLRALGITRQKSHYIRLLAENTHAGFSFESLASQTDETVRAQLTQHKGIGNWTADIYLSECLLRCDVLPPGDIAMLEVYRVLHDQPERLDPEQFEASTQHWRPWRSVAGRMLWHYYLSVKAK